MPKQSDQLSNSFFRHVAPTSLNPLGVVIKEAKGSYLITSEGKRILDFLSGIGVTNVGHSLPQVIEAVCEQAQRHLHVMVYGEFIQQAQVELAELLTEILPEPLDMTYFTSSGAEAVEGAIKLAKKATGRSRLVSFRQAYHGDTTGAMALWADASTRAPFEPLLPDVLQLPFNDFPALERIDEKTAAVFIEPIQAEAGVRLPQGGYLSALKKRCEEVGALLVCDEVQVGLGRSGNWFAFMDEGVVPDVVLMAKALGGGLPLGGFAAKAELLKVLAVDPPLSHLTTFGGHPLSCAAGLAGLKFMKEHDLPARARQMGLILQARLEELVKSGLAEKVTGRGLIWGIEIKRDKKVREIINKALEKGLLIGDALHAPEVIKILPPLNIEQEDLYKGIDILSSVLK
jgi:acetylornithine/N-succinyldiaminopimelate aminotransferase